VTERRVVVTGLGLVSPVGNSTIESWQNARDGVSGISVIDTFDTTGFATTFGGMVKGLDLGAYLEPREARRSDPFIHYGIVSCKQAMLDTGLAVTADNAHRIGVIMGAGIGGLHTIETNYGKYLNGGARKISPYFVPGSIVNMISGHISIEYGLTGPNLAMVTACATSTHCIGLAARLIKSGDADVMLGGGAEYATTVLGIGGFCAARALSTRNDAPEQASRPWDRDRDGFVLSDGAGCMVLEEYEHAKKRGAKIYAELVGFGMSGDAHHITAPAESGEGARRCMTAALTDARVNADEVAYVNAHGTSTPLGDRAETTAIKRAFGDHSKRLAVSSTKSTTGHMLGAAGAAEAIFTVMALKEQVIPPTINFENQDPDCDLDYTPNVARETELEYALSNSFGFGGTNGTLLFKRHQ
jgi:3-oxoacyl-[acyl-carrier-protein] synthase II